MKFISLKEIKYEAFANFLEGYVFSVAFYGTHIKCIFAKGKKLIKDYSNRCITGMCQVHHLVYIFTLYYNALRTLTLGHLELHKGVRFLNRGCSFYESHKTFNLLFLRLS